MIIPGKVETYTKAQSNYSLPLLEPCFLSMKGGQLPIKVIDVCAFWDVGFIHILLCEPHEHSYHQKNKAPSRSSQGTHPDCECLSHSVNPG